MNSLVKTMNTKFLTTFGRTGLKLRKYSPEILLGVGIVGAVGAAVLACKATLKADEIVTETKQTLGRIHEIRATKSEEVYSAADYQKDLAIVYVKTGVNFAKLYGPAIGLGALSIGSILAAHGILQRRNVALIAAYNVVADGFAKYRKNVVDDLGADSDKKYRFGLTEEEVTEELTDENGKKTSVKKKVLVSNESLTSEYARFFDEASVEWKNSAMMNLYFLKTNQTYFNDLLKARGHVLLNEVYDALGLTRTRAGCIVGWIYNSETGDGFIDFDLLNVRNSAAKRDFLNGDNNAILLDFNVDGIIYDKI